MNPEVIGKYIKQLRQKKNLSQQELSEIVHVTRQAISGWENGKNCPDSDLLLALSSLFGVSINDILTGGSKEENIEKVTLELVDDNVKKTSKIKRLIILFISSILILLLCFLSYYFINNYNSIRVYRVAGKSDLFTVRDGMLITTRNELYIKLGEVYDPKKEKEIKEYRVYYTSNGKEYDIIKSEQSNGLYTYKDSYETKYSAQIYSIINNLYLEITYNDNQKDIIFLKVKEQFNNKLNLLSTPPETKKSNLNVENQIETRKILDIITGIKVNAKQDELSETFPVENNKIVENVVQVEETKTEEIVDEKSINYNNIFNIIMEKGVSINGTYRISIEKDNKSITYSLFNNQINVDVLSDNVIEIWNNTETIDSHFSYMMMKDFVEQEQIMADTDNMNEYELKKYNEMTEYLKMLYEY